MLKVKISCGLLAAVMLCPTACFAEDALPATVGPKNPFDIPLSQGNRRFVDALKIEDLSSPYVEAHYAEQGLYTELFRMKYAFINPFVEGSEQRQQAATHASKVVVPPDHDSDGRPLWFDGTEGLEALKLMVAQLYFSKRYDDLDRLYDLWNAASQRMADGQWKIYAFQLPTPYFTTASKWEDALKCIKTWREKSPKSSAAAIFEADYWFAYAWDARGQAYAGAVSEDAWELFKERLLKAKTVLEDSESFSGQSPLWGEYMIKTVAALDVSKSELLHVFEKAQKQNPGYISDYIATSYYLGPKWGGSWDLFDAFVRKAVTEGKTAEGGSLYARLYWRLAPYEENPNIFKYTNVAWTDMRPSFEAMTRLYPHSAQVLNAFASFACMADDKATFQSLRFRIKTSIVADQWFSGYSLDLCEHKFALQPL